jgi:predicted nucleic-acid-binding Zn-ribbon protein
MITVEYNGRIIKKFDGFSWRCPKCKADSPNVKWYPMLIIGGDENKLEVTCWRCGYSEDCLTADYDI